MIDRNWLNRTLYVFIIEGFHAQNAAQGLTSNRQRVGEIGHGLQ